MAEALTAAPPIDFSVEWPTLGYLVADWVERHCPVPDGFRKGDPFVMYGWQLWCTANHYRVRPDAVPAGTELVDDEGRVEQVSAASAFHNRRSVIIAPQKAGKGPWSAALVAAESVGPVLFDGWAEEGEWYRCKDHGCDCGWERQYGPDEYSPSGFEPKGKPWPTPLLQLTATAEPQVDNVWVPLQTMARSRRLVGLMQVTETFIRMPGGGKAEKVSSNARTRLGNPIVFALQDESGLYTQRNGMKAVARTQRRGAAGMGGRTIETSNVFDPTMDSTLQASVASAEKLGDIFVFWLRPPDTMGSFTDPDARRAILRYVYSGCEHIDIGAVDAEASELLADDPAEAERFYGNRDVAGDSKWMPDMRVWDGNRASRPREPARGSRIVIGMDGSDGSNDPGRAADSTVIRGCRLSDGYRWTIGAWHHPYVGEELVVPWYVPRSEVMARIEWAFGYYDVALAGFDPPYWRAQLAVLTEKYGSDRIVEFRTGNDQLMSNALDALAKTDTLHDGDLVVREHVANAVKVTKREDEADGNRRRLVLVTKEAKHSPRKIDAVVSDAIALHMRNVAIAQGQRRGKKRALSAGFE